MDILTLTRELKEAADLVVADKEGRSLLLVEVRTSSAFEAEHLAHLRGDQRKFDFPFAMFVTPDQIRLFGPDQADGPVAQFATAETFRPRNPHFNEHKRLSKFDLVNFVWNWLFDFASSHSLHRPDQLCCLEKVGLADRLVGGEVLTVDMLFKKYAEVGPSF